VRSILSVPLWAGGASVGALTVYSTEPTAFDGPAEHLLQRFARPVAILLANSQSQSDPREMNAQLTDVLQNRDVIARAQGLLLERGAADDAAAFGSLVGTSQRADTTMHVVARYLLASVTSRNANRTPDATARTAVNGADSRSQLFEAAHRSADWTLEQLWLSYLALGGTLVVFDLETYLAGLAPIPADQQNVLACALNERLADLSHPGRVPYLAESH
jgi:signal transduction protein with GAF and PtsI domain